MNIPRTARLNFKLMDENDSALLFELDNDPQVMEYLTRGKTTTMSTIKDVFIPRMQAYRNPQQGWGLWQVNLNDNDSFIGWILIRPMGFLLQSLILVILKLAGALNAKVGVKVTPVKPRTPLPM